MFEMSTQYLLGIDTEPRIKERGVNLPKIERCFKVPLVQIIEPRMQPDNTAADWLASDKYGTRDAVVGARGTVFRHAATKFAEGQHDDAIVELGGFQIVQKG